MMYTVNGVDYEVVIEKKNNKNLYIRFKDDNKIHVTCNYLTSKTLIKNVLDSNLPSLIRMINNAKIKQNNNNKFFYLGKAYDIILDESVGNVVLSDNKIYAKDLNTLNKWLKDETIRVFDERYVYIFNHFNENIKSPILKIREMKTRWGVYNKKNHTITLNSKLIEYDYDKIDYVIIHELSHIIHFNHSKSFWDLVSKYCANYKKIRKEMK